MRIKSSKKAGRWIWRAVTAAGLASVMLVTNPTTIALQDVTAMIAGDGTNADRWMTHLTPSGAGSTHAGTVHFQTDPLHTGAIVPMPGGIKRPGSDVLALEPAKVVQPETADEDRVNRVEKTGRLVSIAPTAPPKAFSAGTVMQRQSNLLKPSFNTDDAMAFVKGNPKAEALQIAAAFHVKSPKPVAADNLQFAVASLVTNATPDILATAYAPPKPDFARQSPFAGLIKAQPAAAGRFIPPAAKNDHSWVHKPLPAESFSQKEQRCLAIGIYFEARGEPAEGQAAVSQVILNRVRNPTFPDSICGVVYQNSHWRNRCQFSFTCDGIKDRVTSPKHWKLAQDIAMATTAGKIWLDDIGSSTHYHANYVNPRWAHSMKRLTKIGLHIFYRTYNGGWS